LTIAACAGASSDGGASPNTSGFGGSTGTAGSGSGGPGVAGTTGSGGTGGTGGTLPPETELESSYEVPVATGHFIWVANPQSGRVAHIDDGTPGVHNIQDGSG